LETIVAVGRVVRFDHAKGYGFIVPDEGGDDVFVHTNELIDHGVRITAGTRVKFEVIESDRGPKAYNVTVLAAPRKAQVVSGHGSDSTEVGQRFDGADDLVDVLSEQEFLRTVTELLVVGAPQLTGEQIQDLRVLLLKFGRDHGWIE
jgi:cold shock CspA family protein